MAGKPVGTIFAELALDTTSYTKSQREILASASQTAPNVEKNWKIIGEKSDVMYDAMRQRIQNAYERIANSATATQQEIVRAKQAAADKIKSIDEQQFGTQTSLLDSMKKNYIATAAIVAAAWMTVSKAMAYAELGAKAKQAEESFRIVSAASGENADKLIADMKRAAQGTVDDSDIMQKAVKGMVLGLKGDEITRIMDAARVAARFAGEDVKTAYESITEAIATGMPRALKRYGLATKEESAIVEKALKEGVEGINLYTIAMINAEIQAAKMGAMQRNAAEGIQIFKAQMNELKESIGNLVIEIGVRAFGVLKTFAGLLTYAAAPIAYLIGGQEAWNAMLASADDLLRQVGKLTGENTEAVNANAAATADSSAATIERLQKEKAAWLEKIKTQLGAKEAAKEALALEKEILRAQDQIAAAVARIAAKMEKDKQDAIKFNRQEENRLFDEQKKNYEEYQKIVTESNDWSISEHQRAINKILSDESQNVARMYELWEAGSINIEQLTSGLAAVRGAAAVATEAQLMKELREELSIYEELAGFEETWYEKKLDLLDKEIELLRAKYNLTKDVTDAMRAQGEMKVASDLWEKEHKNQKEMLKSTYDMIDATAEMFDRESRGYKTMMDLKKAAHVVEMAMNLEKAISTFALAQAKAAEAVAAQATVPVAGFGMAAAMLAFLSSVLAMAGISFGGGGSSASASALPPSTVLGAAAGTGSESIGRAWEKMMDIDTLQYTELRGIHDSMKELNDNITGLVTSIFRTGGTGSFSIPGMETGGAGKATSILATLNLATLGLSDYIGDAVKGFLGFGDKTFSLKGGGIEFGAAYKNLDTAFHDIQQTVNDFVSGMNVAAVQFSSIEVTYSKGDKGFISKYKTLDSDVQNMLNGVFFEMSNTLETLTEKLGTDMQATLNYVFKGGRLDLTGMTGEEAQKAVAEYFSNIADEAAQALFGTLVGKYQKLDEGMYETAVRVVTDMEMVMATLDLTGQHLEGTIPQIIAMSEALVDFAGGLDKLTDAASTYYDKFFTDAEKQARLMEQLSSGLGSLGYALPTDRMGYRSIVEGLDLSTEAGQRAYVMLLEWAEAADQYYSAVEDAAGGTDKLTEALKRQSETIAKWLADLNKSTLAPVMSAQAQEAAYAAAKASAFTPGATEAQTSAFLTAASDYLKFARAYSGDYTSIYQSVVGDVQALADAIALALTQANLPAHAGGGLTRGPTITGEMGQEWNVPTYEPRRSRFLESAPPQFWENLRGAGVVQPGGGGDITVRVPVYLDGKMVADVVAKHIPRSSNLSDAIRRVN